jgi:Rrf2 family iron-sulfur cluster assembly transcriptional regulator
MFSKACEYGIRSAILIAKTSLQGERIGIKEIAKEIDSPEAFTAKILQILTRGNIIQSTKGVKGGFEISESQMKRILLADLVNAIDGNSIYSGCGLGLPSCNEDHPCPIHHKFKEVRSLLHKVLVETSLYDLAMGINSGTVFLKI